MEKKTVYDQQLGTRVIFSGVTIPGPLDLEQLRRHTTYMYIRITDYNLKSAFPSP